MKDTVLCKAGDELCELLEKVHITDKAISDALIFRQDVLLDMANPDYETKRRILELLGVQVLVKDRKANVSCVIPNDAVGIELDSYLPTT